MMRKNQLSTLLTCFSFVSGASAGSVGRAPTEYDGPYEPYRATLIADGWKPFPDERAEPCEAYMTWCQSRDERVDCKISGPLPECTWRWIKGRSIRVVATTIEQDWVISVATFPR